MDISRPLFDFLVIQFLWRAWVTADTDCSLNSGSFCSCTTQDDGSTLDLSPISSSSGTPYFQKIKGAAGWRYDYDPCAPFVWNKCKDNVLVCQGGGSVCGRDTSIEIVITGRNPDKGNLTYGGGDELKNIPRKTIVSFVCDPSKEAEMMFVEEYPGGVYNFALSSKHTCLSTPAPQPTTKPPATKPHRQSNQRHVSLGTIMCICLLLVVVVYASGGYAYMFVRRQARGREAIPNYEFWTSVPGLWKEGVTFIVHKIRSMRGGGSGGYDAL